MAWMTMHWSLFTKPGWNVHRCVTKNCALGGGVSHAACARSVQSQKTTNKKNTDPHSQINSKH